ncbi:MAG: sigma-70 family RNA polymerase sigma factor [Myxococcota bacterium]
MEAAIRAQVEAGALQAAVEASLAQYGAEVFGLLLVLTKEREQAKDAFADMTLSLLESLPSFRWEASLRTWMYRVAKNALVRRQSEAWQRKKSPLGPELLSALEAVERTTTAVFLKSEVKDQVRRLRDELEVEEQALLSLRVDRQLPFEDVAEILGLRRDQAPTARKRYERVVEKLRKIAEREGLLGGQD